MRGLRPIFHDVSKKPKHSFLSLESTPAVDFYALMKKESNSETLVLVSPIFIFVFPLSLDTFSVQTFMFCIVSVTQRCQICERTWWWIDSQQVGVGSENDDVNNTNALRGSPKVGPSQGSRLPCAIKIGNFFLLYSSFDRVWILYLKLEDSTSANRNCGQTTAWHMTRAGGRDGLHGYGDTAPNTFTK
jgi:hypothetical protein